MTTAAPTLTWADCLAYLEAHCNPLPPPFPPETVRYAQLLWVLAEALAVESVLEVGIGPTSVSGCTWIHSMATRGGGKLYSIDNDVRLPQPKFRALAQALNVEWTVQHGDSLWVDAPADLHVDLLYIDGDHDEAHAYGDTLKYLTHLRVGGYLVIDDYPGFDGVKSAALRLHHEFGLNFIHLAHHPPHGNGRLLWQKPR